MPAAVAKGSARIRCPEFTLGPQMCSTELDGSEFVRMGHLRHEEGHRRQWVRRLHQAFGIEDAPDYDAEVRKSPRTPRVSLAQVRRIEDTHAFLCAKVDPVMGPLILALISKKPENVQEAAINHLLAKKKERIEGENTDGEATVSRGEHEIGNGIDSGVDENGNKDRDDCGAASGAQRQASRQDRLFMAREVSPFVTSLISRALRCRPADVETFLIEELQSGNILIRRNDKVSSHERLDLRRPHSNSRTSAANDGHDPHAHPDNKHYVDCDTQDHLKQQQQQQQQQQPQRRSSTARSRLQHAKRLDLEVQSTTPPLSARASSQEALRPSRNTHLQEDISIDEQPPFLSDVTDSQYNPRDAEVLLPANILSTEAPSPGVSETLGNQAPQVAVVLLLGLDAAGKTTLLGTLQGEKDPRVRPSVGFTLVTMMLSDQLKVKFYDLGGGRKIRSIWDKYYHDAHALLYVVDGADGERWEETKELFLAATRHKYLQGKPLAIIINKEDMGIQIKPSFVMEELGLSARGNAQVYSCSVNAAKAKGGVFDDRLETAVEWLLGSVKGRFAELNERVQGDIRDMDKEFQLEKERKQLDVMRGLLRKTFLEDEVASREDRFDESQGLEFLASELGVEVGNLPAEGAHVAALVGYQRLALQMVGNMKSPVSKKNQAWTWDEIRDLVVGLRQEIGLDR